MGKLNLKQFYNDIRLKKVEVENNTESDPTANYNLPVSDDFYNFTYIRNYYIENANKYGNKNEEEHIRVWKYYKVKNVDYPFREIFFNKGISLDDIGNLKETTVNEYKNFYFSNSTAEQRNYFTAFDTAESSFIRFSSLFGHLLLHSKNINVLKVNIELKDSNEWLEKLEDNNDYTIDNLEVGSIDALVKNATTTDLAADGIILNDNTDNAIKNIKMNVTNNDIYYSGFHNDGNIRFSLGYIDKDGIFQRRAGIYGEIKEIFSGDDNINDISYFGFDRPGYTVFSEYFDDNPYIEDNLKITFEPLIRDTLEEYRSYNIIAREIIELFEEESNDN